MVVIPDRASQRNNFQIIPLSRAAYRRSFVMNDGKLKYFQWPPEWAARLRARSPRGGERRP
jgi:hypothetical protein